MRAFQLAAIVKSASQSAVQGLATSNVKHLHQRWKFIIRFKTGLHCSWRTE